VQADHRVRGSEEGLPTISGLERALHARSNWTASAVRGAIVYRN